MVSPTINVVRYSALIGGIGYGIWHQRTLQKKHDKQKVEGVVKRRQHWVEEAKKEWAKRQGASSSSGVITDPDAPGFDLEKFLLKLEAEGA